MFLWFIIGIVLGLSLMFVANGIRRKAFHITWYEWTIAIIGLLLLLFTLQNYIVLSEQGSSTPANMFLLVTGLPAIILLLVAWQLRARHKKAA